MSQVSQQNEELRKAPSSRIMVSQNQDTIDLVSELRQQVQSLQGKLAAKKEKIAALKSELIEEKLRYKANLQRQERYLTQHRPSEDMLTFAQH